MKKTTLLFVTFALVLTPALVMAQTGVSSGSFPNGVSAGTLPNGSSASNGSTATYNGQSLSIQNPLAVSSFCGLLKLLFGALVQLGIPIAVIFLILAGARFVFAMGNPGALTKARETLKYTIIGIALFLGAWLIVMAISATLSQLGVTLLSCA